MGIFRRGVSLSDEVSKELSGVSLQGLLESVSNRSERENAIAVAWVKSMPLWCHQAIRFVGGYHDTSHTYGHGGLCHNATFQFEKALEEQGYKIVPILKTI